jgi:hypothetical protein
MGEVRLLAFGDGDYPCFSSVEPLSHGVELRTEVSTISIRLKHPVEMLAKGERVRDLHIVTGD